MRTFLREVVLLVVSFGTIQCLFIDGCPIYGCRPSGSFSFLQNVPRTNVSINWVNQFPLDPVPFAAGCVSDSVNIVCLSNGVFSEDKGYVSIYGENGTLRWRDRYLTYPTLPLLDNYGDVTGTDGVSLVHYDQDGKKYPIISVQGLAPVFNIQLVGYMFLLMVSENGGLFLRDTNAIPVAAIYLNATVQRTNGTFIPISQPVVNGQRFYVLTEFVPSSNTRDPSVLNLQRLYAIDVHDRMADIMTIAWYFNFEMEMENVPDSLGSSENMLQNLLKNIRENRRSKQVLLWDYSSETIYVTLPRPYKYDTSTSDQPNTFWALKDSGNDTSLSFRSNWDVTHMATFEADTCAGDTCKLRPSKQSELWLSTSSSHLYTISSDGKITKDIDLNAMFNTQVVITSKMSLVRENDTSADVLIVGIKTNTQTRDFEDSRLRFLPHNNVNTTYVIAIDTASENGTLLWTVPVPNGLEVKGQITGSSGADYRRKDQLVMYADDGGKIAKIISLQ